MKRTKLSNRAAWILSATITAIALAVACGGDETRSRKEIVGGGAGAPKAGAPKAAASNELKKVDPATGGTVSGVVKFEGTAPAPEPIDLTPECSKISTEQSFKEDLVVKDGKVEFAFVYVDVKDAYEPSAETVTIDQKGCRYRPHVTGVQAGQNFEIKSSDPFLHNAHYIGKVNGENNLAMSKPGSRMVKFEVEDGMLKFKCDVHPFMGAWVGIMKHPFFATSAVDGTFTIKNVPPGEYDLVLHHENAKLAGQDQRLHVKVETGKTTTQDFTLKFK